MGVSYVLAGVLHFATPEFYLQIMPPYLPWHLALVYVSGVAEILLGILVIIPATRIVGAWGIILLLIAIFPANLHAAMNDVQLAHRPAAVLERRDQRHRRLRQQRRDDGDRRPAEAVREVVVPDRLEIH